MLQRLRKNKGFTIIELMICIAIIAILLAVTIPMITLLKEKLEQEQSKQQIVQQEHVVEKQETPTSKLKKIE